MGCPGTPHFTEFRPGLDRGTPKNDPGNPHFTEVHEHCPTPGDPHSTEPFAPGPPVLNVKWGSPGLRRNVKGDLSNPNLSRHCPDQTIRVGHSLPRSCSPALPEDQKKVLSLEVEDALCSPTMLADNSRRSAHFFASAQALPEHYPMMEISSLIEALYQLVIVGS